MEYKFLWYFYSFDVFFFFKKKSVEALLMIASHVMMIFYLVPQTKFVLWWMRASVE